MDSTQHPVRQDRSHPEGALDGLRVIEMGQLIAGPFCGQLIDTLAATFARLGGMMALHARYRTGRGQMVDSAVYEAVLAVVESLVSEYVQTGDVRKRTKGILTNIVPSNVCPIQDGFDVLIAANQDTGFRRLTAAMGRAELADDPRYATHDARGERQAELDAVIADWTRTQDRVALGALLDEARVPRGSICRGPEMLEDPRFKARETIARVKARETIARVMHPTFGELRMQNLAPRLSETPGRIRDAGPPLGQHNEAALGGLLGLHQERLSQLQAA